MKKLVKDIYGLLKTENPGIAADTMLARTAFEEMDKDADGKVSQEEFVFELIEHLKWFSYILNC